MRKILQICMGVLSRVVLVTQISSLWDLSVLSVESDSRCKHWPGEVS